MDLRLFMRRFDAYVDVFTGKDSFVDANIGIKTAHTRRVCRHALDIARSLESSRSERQLAFLAALFHDTGRFPQIHRYGTFNDQLSENHAVLGVREIKTKGLLNGLATPDRRRILTSVMLHNRRNLPASLEPATLRLCRILRDADKLDILDVLIGYYRSAENGSNPALDLDLPRGSSLSQSALADIAAARCVNIEHVHSIQDFRLLQTSWVFDLHSAWSMERVRRLKQIEWLLNQLPPGKDTDTAARRIHTYMAEFQPTLLRGGINRRQANG